MEAELDVADFGRVLESWEGRVGVVGVAVVDSAGVSEARRGYRIGGRFGSRVLRGIRCRFWQDGRRMHFVDRRFG